MNDPPAPLPPHVPAEAARARDATAREERRRSRAVGRRGPQGPRRRARHDRASPRKRARMRGHLRHDPRYLRRIRRRPPPPRRRRCRDRRASTGSGAAIDSAGACRANDRPSRSLIIALIALVPLAASASRSCSAASHSCRPVSDHGTHRCRIDRGARSMQGPWSIRAPPESWSVARSTPGREAEAHRCRRASAAPPPAMRASASRSPTRAPSRTSTSIL